MAVLYQQGLTPLSASVDSNEVSPQHADAYLYGALQHAYDFLMDETRAAKFRASSRKRWRRSIFEFQRVRFPARCAVAAPTERCDDPAWGMAA